MPRREKPLDTVVPRMLTLNDLEKLLPFTGLYIARLAEEGRFPKPVQLSARRLAWFEPEVLAWLEARKTERDAGGPSPLREKRPKPAPIVRRRAA